MKMIIVRMAAAAATAAALCSLASCVENEDQQIEIERLKEQNEILKDHLDSSKRTGERIEKKNKELQASLREANRKVRELGSKLAKVERSLERYHEKERREEAARETEPSRKEKQETARQAVSKSLEALVTVKGDQSSGHGVLVKADGKTWIYVPASVLDGNKELDLAAGGSSLDDFGVFEVAADAGLARLEVTGAADTKLAPADPAELSSRVPLLGINEDEEIVEGRSYRAEAALLQADSRLSACPPGTPVFHGESGGLLGLIVEPAEADEELWDDFRRASYRRVRRMVCRLDRQIDWNPIPIGSFLEEGKVIEDANTLTRLLHAFTAVRPTVAGVAFDAPVPSGTSARELLRAHHAMPAVRALFDLDEWLREKGGRASVVDVKKQIAKVYNIVARASSEQIRDLQTRAFSGFHRPAANQALEWRTTAEKELKALLAGLKD